MTSDVNLPEFRQDLLEKAQLESQIRKICALTGKTVEFAQKFIDEAKLSLNDLKKLVEKIMLDEWSFEDEN